MTDSKSAATTAKYKLMTLNPGHFHAALVQKSMNDLVSPTVNVYAPDGFDLNEHLKRIESYNTRANNPTKWDTKVYKGNDSLEKMLSEKPGNVVVLAGNNQHKIEYIQKSVEAGLNVLSDKPMAIDEAGYEKAVSYTKGCYLGQEIIARIHWRGQPARQLRGLLIDASEPPAKGTELWAADGKKIGEITSSARSFALEQIIALGYVHRYYLTAGTIFTLKRDGAEQGTAVVTETPFVQ